jgi:hypothetical protein
MISFEEMQWGLLLVYENARRGRPSLGGAQVSLATSSPKAIAKASIGRRVYQYIVSICSDLLVSPAGDHVGR